MISLIKYRDEWHSLYDIVLNQIKRSGIRCSTYWTVKYSWLLRGIKRWSCKQNYLLGLSNGQIENITTIKNCEWICNVSRIFLILRRISGCICKTYHDNTKLTHHLLSNFFLTFNTLSLFLNIVTYLQNNYKLHSPNISIQVIFKHCSWLTLALAENHQFVLQIKLN